MIVITEETRVYWDSGKTTYTTKLMPNGYFDTIEIAKKWLDTYCLHEASTRWAKDGYSYRIAMGGYRDRKWENNTLRITDDDVTRVYTLVELKHIRQ